jgi:hypothetical protein
LIERAEEADYQILVTCDQNVRYQQNLTHRTLSMVVLGSNIWPSVKNKLEEIQEAPRLAGPGSFQFIEVPPRARVRRLDQ